VRAGPVVAAGALVLAACTQSPAQLRQDQTPTSPGVSAPAPASASVTTGGSSSTAPETVATASATPTGRGSVVGSSRVRTTAVARLPLPAGVRLTGLAVSQERVAWTACRSCRAPDAVATEVRVAAAPRAGAARVVARTSPGRTATVLGFAGDALIWLDVGADRGKSWALRLVDVRTGTTRSLAEGEASGPGAGPPVVSISGRTVTWQLYDLAAGRGPVLAQDVGGGRSRVVVPDLPGQLRGVTVQGLVYTANDPAVPTVVPNAPVPYDMYLWSSAGRPRNLTRGHNIAEAVATADGVVWRVVADAESLVYAPWPGGTPVRLVTGPVRAFGAGRGFGAWVTREEDAVVQLSTGGSLVTLPDAPPPDGGKLAVDSDLVAFVGAPDRGGPSWSLVVVRVVSGAR